MITLDQSYIHAPTLHEQFNLSNLFILREYAIEVKKRIENTKESSLSSLNLKLLTKTEKRLHFINQNIRIIEDIMMLKENEIFKTYFNNDFCLN